MPESQHKTGEEGLDFTKRWLESTTWMELGFNAYTNPAVCTLERLDGTKKVWDLFGSLFHTPPTPVYRTMTARWRGGGCWSAATDAISRVSLAPAETY